MYLFAEVKHTKICNFHDSCKDIRENTFSVAAGGNAVPIDLNENVTSHTLIYDVK